LETKPKDKTAEKDMKERTLSTMHIHRIKYRTHICPYTSPRITNFHTPKITSSIPNFYTT